MERREAQRLAGCLPAEYRPGIPRPGAGL
jgi:hypothetical protein